MSSSNCCFLTCIWVSQEAGQVVWYSHLFQNFPQFVVMHTVNKAEVDIFLELSCFLDDPTDVGNLISGSSAFSKTSWNISKFMLHLLLKPGLDNFEHYFTSMWDECNCAWVWASSGRWWRTGKLACCSPWGCKEPDTTEQLNNCRWNDFSDLLREWGLLQILMWARS